ncbi:MAG: dual specificity protein phosphatase family protein [Nitrospiraceae bacterium]|nr:dual specificity protein phosphatase family protein [Nitrospiraceae bacterium]
MEITQRPKKRRRIFLAVFIVLLIPAGYFGAVFGNGNFHAVTPGEAYRCDQPGYGQLEDYLKTYHIRSIFNLRGRNAGDKWYKDEIKFSEANGVRHYDIALSASSEPDRQQVQEILNAFRTAPRPVLIHCKSGADRSGLVSAMWKMVIDKEPKAEAGRELSIRYGHMPIGSTTAMDRFFEAWNPSAASLNNSSGTTAHP